MRFYSRSRCERFTSPSDTNSDTKEKETRLNKHETFGAWSLTKSLKETLVGPPPPSVISELHDTELDFLFEFRIKLALG